MKGENRIILDLEEKRHVIFTANKWIFTTNSLQIYTTKLSSENHVSKFLNLCVQLSIEQIKMKIAF